jgi:hypothetical protein
MGEIRSPPGVERKNNTGSIPGLAGREFEVEWLTFGGVQSIATGVRPCLEM